MPNDIAKSFDDGQINMEAFCLTGNKRMLGMALVKLMEVYDAIS